MEQNSLQVSRSSSSEGSYLDISHIEEDPNSLASMVPSPYSGFYWFPSAGSAGTCLSWEHHWQSQLKSQLTMDWLQLQIQLQAQTQI